MAIGYHPEPGTILICDYHGFIEPEMIKRRPVVVLGPRLRGRDGLCTVVPLSTTEPETMMNYHHKLHFSLPLPTPYDSEHKWVKGDMFSTVAFSRLYLPCLGKDDAGKRIYDVRILDKADFKKVQLCVLNALGLSGLTEYL
jgi:mRNA interferase MazF